MNCSNCKQPISSSSVCPNCGKVNMPTKISFKEWVKGHQRIVLVATLALLLVVCISITAYILFFKPAKTASVAAPKTAPKPTTTSNPAPRQEHSTNVVIPQTVEMKVLVLKYFPLTPNGQNIDINVTGDVGDSYPVIRQRTVDITNNLVAGLARATKYLGYRNPSAPSALSYRVVDTKEYKAAVPIKPEGNIPTYPDYQKLLTDNAICNYVNQGVTEVWIWAYQGPNRADGYPSLGISESKMSGPYGDVSNSWRFDDMPKCGRTYRVYTFNYGRGTAEALHSWSHQLEAELTAVDPELFKVFQGSTHPQVDGVTGRCGSVHNPPNSRQEYDYSNPTPQKSDCLDWNPDGMGQLSDISCQTWGCQFVSDTDNPQYNWLIWNLQNIPGLDNTKTYQGKKLRNWWEVHADFDGVMSGTNRSLTLP